MSPRPQLYQPGDDARAAMRAAGWGSGHPDDAQARTSPDATVERIRALPPANMARRPKSWTVAHLGLPLEVGSATFPHVLPAPSRPRRSGFVALHAPPRLLAEVHEDVCRFRAWPEGGWCE